MSRDRMKTILETLPSVRAAVRGGVARRLKQGARIGGAVDGKVIELSEDSGSGHRRERGLAEYGHGPAVCPPDAAPEVAPPLPEREAHGRRPKTDQ